MSDIPKFEETEEIIPKFDETEEIRVNQELTAPPEVPMPKMSAADAVVAGGLQGVSFGFADEIKAGLEAPFSDKTYEQLRDEERALYAAAEKQHPKTMMAADLGFGMLTGGTALKGIKAGASALKNTKTAKELYDKYQKLSKAKKAAVTAGSVGAVEGAGRSEGDTLGEIAQDAALTGGLSTVLGGAAGKISDNLTQKALAKKAAEKSSDANIGALQSIGAGASDIAEEIGAGTSKRAGLETAKGTGTALLDENLIKVSQKPEDLVTAINSKLDDVYENQLKKRAQEIDERLINKQGVLQRATDEFYNNSLNTIQDFEKAANYTLKDGPALSEGAGRVIMNIVNELKSAPNNQKLSTAIKARQQIRDMTNFSKSDIPQAQQFYKEVYGNLNKYIDNLANQADENLAKQFKQSNELYGRLSSGREIAVDNLTKTLGTNKLFGEGDFVVPASAGALASQAFGLPAGLATAGALAGKKVLENKTGKNLTQLFKSYKSKVDYNKAKNLQKRADNYGGLDKAVSELDAKKIGVASGIASGVKNDTNEINLKKDAIRQYGEKASSEELKANAQAIRDTNGKTGEKLASEIEAMADKDTQGRRAAIFSIMQDPNNREMLNQLNEPMDAELELQNEVDEVDDE